MNKVIFIGRVAKDIEVRRTQGGKQVCQFPLAVNRPYAKNGEVTADFFNMVAWEKTADVIGRYCTKGSKIAVEGRLLNRSYDDKEGKKRWVTEVQIEHVEFLDSAKEKEKESSLDEEEIPF